MSKEPAEIFERAAEEGFITQVLIISLPVSWHRKSNLLYTSAQAPFVGIPIRPIKRSIGS